METRGKRGKTEPVVDKIRRGEISVVVAIAEELPDVFIAEILPKLDLISTLNLAQVSKWYNDAVWSVDGVRSMKAKIEAQKIKEHEAETGKSVTVHPMYFAAVHPMYFAARYGNVPAVRALLKSGVGVNEILSCKWTALHTAAFYSHAALVKALIEAGADVNMREHYGYTSLHRAAFKGHAPVITELIKAGADVNATDDDGYSYTPLHRAAWFRHEDCVAVLLAHGADVHKRISTGQTAMRLAVLRKRYSAMKLAVYCKNKKIIKMLKQAGG